MIDTEKDNRKIVERAFLVGLQDIETPLKEAKDHLYELKELVKTLDIPVLDSAMVNLRQPFPKYLLGTGKTMEIKEKIKELKADCIVFDGELSPSQQRNWEKLTKVCVIDRQEVILDIFASRASTREAVLQVDLARMKYSLPRLTRAWTHLSRQRGGAKGTRGEGEQQIEVDKRIIKQRISALQKELKEVRQHRTVQRKKRNRAETPHGAIVGYTNAGKSSLMNALSGASVLVEDKLFATLDPTTRKILLPDNRQVLLTDTVGFIRKLPHHLVEAFKSTLEEAILAEFLIHVLDVTSVQVEENLKTTLSVLEELGAKDKKIITVFNKIDLLHNDPVTFTRLRNTFPESHFISANSGEGLDNLIKTISNIISDKTQVLNLMVPPSRYDVISLAHSKSKVLSTEYKENGTIELVISATTSVANHFKEFSVN